MTTPTELQDVMDHYSGGSDTRYRHWANPRFLYSEGVKAMADTAGAHWLLDIVATEVVPVVMNGDYSIYFLQVVVNNNNKAELYLGDDVPAEHLFWVRDIDFTDFPEGRWTFYICNDGVPVVMILKEEY